MVQPCKHAPASPRAAARRRAALDRVLDAPLFRVLGDPTRLRLLSCLARCRRPCSTTETAACCDLDFSTVSRHLAALRDAGILRSRKDGRTVWHEADAAGLAARLRAVADALDAAAAAPEGCDCRPPDCGPRSSA